MSGSFYVYAHKSDCGKTFYIGKGTGKRAWSRQGRTVRWQRHAAKHGFNVYIVRKDMAEPCAFTLEKALIHAIGIENLCNLTTGGEGTSGRVPSLEQREKCRMKNKGRKPSAQTQRAAKEKTSKKVATTCGLIFDSITDAAKFVCIDENVFAAKSSISACCNGKRVGQCYGYEFRFFVNGSIVDSGFRTKKRGIPVKTECGLFFENATKATKWLQSNGHLKAINSNITQNCKGKVASAYGYRWSYA